MFQRIISFCCCVFVLVGCSTNAPDIHTLCLRDRIGNYLIKWETNPPIEGTVKIYVSDNPERFSKKDPAVYANISQGIATYVTNDNMTRQYFRLTFNDKYSQVVGARAVMMDSVQNLRDMGGYFNSRNKMVRWGKVYRSGDISRLSIIDFMRLKKLDLKTVIDLRSLEEMSASPLALPDVKVISIPLTGGNLTDIEPFLREGRVRKGDAVVYMQDLYIKFITENSEAFTKALEVFLDKDNYPILFNCSLGKDGTGLLAAMLLTSLSVSDETIMSDYLSSNDYIILQRYAPLARHLSQDSQEAITVLLTANESFVDPLLKRIKNEYGSMENFLSTELGMTDKDRDKLKDILLY